MKNPGVALPFFLSTLVGCAESRGGDSVAPAADLALSNVTVLSPIDGSVNPETTVLLTADQILEVGRRGDVDAPAGATVVDAAGLYAIPGLWDFHTHLALADSNAAPLMVTQGVTGARDLGGDLGAIDRLRDRVRRGELLGPRIARAGPTLNGAPHGAHHRVIDTPDAARAAVAELRAHGVDLLKTHNATARDVYFALLEAASEAGLDVAGHVPLEVSPLEACEAGHRSVEHIATLFEGTYLARFSSELEAFRSMGAWLESEAEPLIECFARQETIFVPTLRAYEVRAHRAALFDDPDPRMRYLRPSRRARFREAMEPSETDRNPNVIALRESLVEIGAELTRRLHAAGAPIGTGTDFAGPGILPGFDLHREIALLVEAGLLPQAALWASARGPGERAGAHPLTGQIVAGAPADLVLLRANAFEEIEALSSIEAVVLRGRLLDRAELDRVLSALASGL